MYLGVPPFGQTVRTITEKVAVLNQVDFYPDGGYLPGYIDIQLNGQSLLSTDFFATDGIKVTLIVACSALDEFRSVAYWPVSLVDTYRKFEADAKFLQYYNGKAGVGTTTPQKLFVVSNGGANGIEISPDDASTSNLNRMLSYNRSTGAYTPMVFQGSEYRIYTKGASADEVVRVDNAGVVQLLQGQLKFPASQNASSDANTLDDYEEGTFTPRSGTNISILHARYTKIGRQVTVYGTIGHSGAITPYDGIQLPFAPDNNGGSSEVRYTGGVQFFESGTGTSVTNMRLLWQGNLGTTCYFWAQSGGQSWTHSIAFDGSNGVSQVTFSLTYIAA